ncbi:MAG: lipocalin family protein [Bacteroidales bacterium]|nr:lipocalin family protein [Bacteroidales bacterium]
MAIMKKISVLFLFVVAVMLSGCKKATNDDLYSLLIGEWELVDYSTKSVTIGEEQVSVFIAFIGGTTTNEFSLRQNIGDGYLNTFTGTWTLSDNMLSGVYSDGTAWGNTYVVSMTDDDTMIMETTVGTAEKYTYKRIE